MSDNRPYLLVWIRTNEQTTQNVEQTSFPFQLAVRRALERCMWRGENAPDTFTVHLCNVNRAKNKMYRVGVRPTDICLTCNEVDIADVSERVYNDADELFRFDVSDAQIQQMRKLLREEESMPALVSKSRTAMARWGVSPRFLPSGVTAAEIVARVLFIVGVLPRGTAPHPPVLTHAHLRALVCQAHAAAQTNGNVRKDAEAAAGR